MKKENKATSLEQSRELRKILPEHLSTNTERVYANFYTGVNKDGNCYISGRIGEMFLIYREDMKWAFRIFGDSDKVIVPAFDADELSQLMLPTLEGMQFEIRKSKLDSNNNMSVYSAGYWNSDKEYWDIERDISGPQNRIPARALAKFVPIVYSKPLYRQAFDYFWSYPVPCSYITCGSAGNPIEWREIPELRELIFRYLSMCSSKELEGVKPTDWKGSSDVKLLRRYLVYYLQAPCWKEHKSFLSQFIIDLKKAKSATSISLALDTLIKEANMDPLHYEYGLSDPA